MLAPVQFHNRSLADPHIWQGPAQNAALLEESTRIGLDPSEWRGKCPKNGVLEPRLHGTFLHVTRQTRRQPSQLHYISRDQPNAHELTNHIRHPSPEPGLQSPGTPESGGAGGVGLSPCHQLVHPAALPGYSELVLRTESDFCGRARIQLANQLIPTNLNKCNKVNNLNIFNKLHNDKNRNNLNKRDINNNDNNYNNINNYHSQDRHMFPASKREHSQTIWSRCRFGLGREKEETPCVPNWFWRDHESTIFNTWRPNHNEVQSVTAVKWFRRER